MKGCKLLFVSCAVLVSTCLLGQSPQVPQVYICPAANGDLHIDGFANEAAWEIADWTDDFVDIEGAKKPFPEFRTRIKMLWDEKALYIYAELEEPHIWAKIAERDQVIFHDNDFEVFIDPNGDNHNYFELEVNALATVFDLFLNRPYNAGGRPLIAWDISDLKCAVHIDGTINNPINMDNKWTVELAIPWKPMLAFASGRRPPKNGEVWRMNFSRVQWETEIKKGNYEKSINPDTGKPFPENNWVWSPQGVVNMHLPERWGYVAFYSDSIPDGLTPAKADPFYNEKLVLLDFYRQQLDYYKKNNKFAGSLYELNKQGRSSIRNITIEATSRQFLISIANENGNKVFIDHQKKIWIE